MDTLKELSEVLLPDPRSEMYKILDPETGKLRTKTIEDHYAIVSKIILHDGVPEKIREHFETTKNILLYSWFVFRFIPVAEFHAATTLEYALKHKTEGKIRGLNRLIEHAISEGWVKNKGFNIWQHHERMREEEKKMYDELGVLSEKDAKFYDEPYDYLEKLKESIPSLRNIYAHGSSMIHSGGYAKLEICAEFINQLYEGNEI